MTVEQLERGIKIQEEISELEDKLSSIKNMQNTKHSHIRIGTNAVGSILIDDIDFAHEVLYKAEWRLKARIDRLEREFEKL